MQEENTPVLEAVVEPTAAPEVTPEPVVEKTFTQKELDDILEKRLSKERRKREDLQRRLSVTEELALKARPPEPKAEPEGAPKRDQFDSYEDFLKAEARFEAKREAQEEIKREREKEKASKVEAERAKVTESFRNKVREAAKDIPDIEEVLSSSDAPVTQAMSEAILDSEAGAKIAHFLAKNTDEAERIAALPAVRQIAEIAKLELKLGESKPTPKTASKAPEPIKPVTGKSGIVDAEPSHNDPDAWMRWRNKQRAAGNRR